MTQNQFVALQSNKCCDFFVSWLNNKYLFKRLNLLVSLKASIQTSFICHALVGARRHCRCGVRVLAKFWREGRGLTVAVTENWP